jgi:beta-lactamase class A
MCLHRMGRWALVVTIVFLVTPGIPGVGSDKAEGIHRLQARVEELARSFPGTIGVYARNIETGAEAGYKADELFPMASVYKISIMVQVFREVDAGRLSLNDRIELGEPDRRLGSGLLTYMTPGLKPTLHDLLMMMITVSDNEATDKLLSMVGAKNVTATMKALGIKDIRVDRPTSTIIADWLAYSDPSFRNMSLAQMIAPSHPDVFDKITPEQFERGSKAFAEDPRDHASPRGMSELLVKIFHSEAASEKSCHDMLEILKLQQFNDRIPRYLPESTPVAHKTGEIGYTRNDAGIIYAGNQHIVVAIFALRASGYVSEQETYQRAGEIARAIYDYFQYGG